MVITVCSRPLVPHVLLATAGLFLRRDKLLLALCIVGHLHVAEELIWHLLKHGLLELSLLGLLAVVHRLYTVSSNLTEVVELVEEVPLVVVKGANKAENDRARVLGQFLQLVDSGVHVIERGVAAGENDKNAVHFLIFFLSL